MKKKFLLALTGLVCALCCAFSLAACGGNDDDATKKHHTAEQWSAAFSDTSVTDCYSFREFVFPSSGTTGYQICSLNYDKNSEYFFYATYENTVNGDQVSTSTALNDIAFKVGGHYYSEDGIPGDTTVYEITSNQFTSKINNNSFAGDANRLLNYCKNNYDNFKANGVTVWNDTYGRYYKAENVPLATDQTLSLVLDEVVVGVTDDGALYEIEATFVENEDRHKYNYRNDNPDSYANVWRSAPTRLEGKTFGLAAINVTHGEGVPSHEYDGWTTDVLVANSGKTITAKADGTLEGNIVIDMVGGASLALNTMKYTENFFNVGTYGEITVSNEHIPGLTEAQKATLTGNIAGGFSEGGVGYNNAFKLTLNSDGQVFEFYFGLQEAN